MTLTTSSPRLSFIIFDIETTGLPKSYNAHFSDNKAYDSSRIVQIAWKLFDAGCASANAPASPSCISTESFIIQCDGFRIANSHFHGITEERSELEGVPLETALRAFYRDALMADMLIAHNIQFDYNILLNHVFRIKDFECIQRLVSMQKLCTMKSTTDVCRLSGRNGKGFKYPKLVELYQYVFSKPPLYPQHDAGWDVVTLSECVLELIKKGQLHLK